MKKLFGQASKKFKGKLKGIGTAKLILAVVLIFVLSFAYTIYQYMEREYVSHITLTLNYANGKSGLTPSGARFNISDIKSDEVIEGALDILHDDSLSVESVRPRIRINTKMPQSSLDQVKSAVAGSTTYTYCPSEFMIYYSQKDKLAKNTTNEFLRALAESYTDYFGKNYASKNIILEFDMDEALEPYDYSEQYQVVYDKLASMLSYLNQRQLENDNFRSESTGYSFGNLISLLGNVRDVDLAKLNAYIVQNGISKNKILFIHKQQYNIDKKMLQYNTLNQGSQIAKDAMEEYDEHLTGVAFIPTVDKQNEFYMARTKTGLDNLVTQSFNNGVNAVEKKKAIDHHAYMIDQFSEAADSTVEQTDSVENMMQTICNNLEKISTLAVQTDNDYIKEKIDNYITFYYPSVNYQSYLVLFLKTMVVLTVLLLLLVILFEKLKKIIDRRLSKVSGNISKLFTMNVER